MKKTNKCVQTPLLLSTLLLLTSAILAITSFQVNAVSIYPSMPYNITVDGNTTNAYPNGTMLNGSRGSIYSLTINESAPSQKWIGYVGNVIGKYALQDVNGSALYDWTIATVTGELYATKEGAFVSGACEQGTGGSCTSVNPYAGGVPYWPNMTCAVNSTGDAPMISDEGLYFNHTASDEDSYANTFKTTNFVNPGFYAGEKQILDTTVWNSTGGQTCYGVNLLYNNTHFGANTGRNWTEVVLTDGTAQYLDSDLTKLRYDIIYASLLHNDSFGYNGARYDFQMLLPQSGLQTAQPDVAYYFYIELV